MTINDIKSFINGIIGSVIASIIYVVIIENLIKYYKRKISNWKLKKIIGLNISINNKLHIIIPELSLSPNVTTNQFPFQNIIGTNVMSSSLTSKNDFLAAKFIQDSISFSIQQGSTIVTDNEIYPNSNFSFISIGGTNYYSNYVFQLQNYNFYKIQNGAITNPITNTSFNINNTYDYFFISKFKHQNSQNIFILILGLGATGTTAGGYYFATKWKDLVKRFSDNSFGILFKVQHNIYDICEEIEYIEI